MQGEEAAGHNGHKLTPRPPHLARRLSLCPHLPVLPPRCGHPAPVNQHGAAGARLVQRRHQQEALQGRGRKAGRQAGRGGVGLVVRGAQSRHHQGCPGSRRQHPGCQPSLTTASATANLQQDLPAWSCRRSGGCGAPQTGSARGQTHPPHAPGCTLLAAPRQQTSPEARPAGGQGVTCVFGWADWKWLGDR